MRRLRARPHLGGRATGRWVEAGKRFQIPGAGMLASLCDQQTEILMCGADRACQQGGSDRYRQQVRLGEDEDSRREYS